jgi:isoaspartyl peptidase/L-asparaginase-like protein (Ntn-hydrolase superfamily)
VRDARGVRGRLCHITARLRSRAPARPPESIGQRLPRLGTRGGLIALDRSGVIIMRHNTAAMPRAGVCEGVAAHIDIY